MAAVTQDRWPGRARQDVLELHALLSELRRRGWTLVLWGPQHAPELMGAVLRWQYVTDVLLIRNVCDATGYRVPTHRESDVIFNPDVVLYQYHQSPLWTLRAMLALPPPGTPNAPTEEETPKSPECFLQEGLSHAMHTRPLSPSWRGDH